MQRGNTADVRDFTISPIARGRLAGKLAALAAATAVVIALIVAAGPGTVDAAPNAVRADGLRLEALAATFGPATSSAHEAQSARWSGLAERYANTGLSRGQSAAAERLQAIADNR